MSWLRGDLRAAPLAVWAAVVLHLSLLLVQTTAQPPYRGLDEAAHVDMVLSLPDLTDWPAPGEKAIDDRLRATWDEAGYYYGPPSARLAREDAPLPRHARPSFAEAGGTDLDRAQNQMVQHPPLYYALLSAATAVVPDLERWPYDRHLALLRVLSALLLVPLPVLCWLAARRLELDRTAGVAAAFLPLLMPSVQRVAASVSNDGLLVLLFAAVNVLAVAVAAGDLRRRTAAALGLLTAAALLTKGFALVLPVVVLAAYAVAARARSVRPAWAPALLATALTALGGWWYVRNLVLHGAVQPNGYRGGRLPYDPSPGEPVAGWAAEYVDAMLFRFWSSLGVPEPPALDERLSSGLTAGLLALALLAVAVARGRRLRVLLALLPFAGLLVLVTTGSYLNHAEYGRMVGVQGRYLYPGLAGLCAAVALALARLSGPLRRGVPLALLAGAGVLQALAARAVLETWWTPADAPGALGAGLRTLAVWSPLPAGVVRALWAAPPVAAVAAVAASALLLRRDRPLPDAGAAPAAVGGGAPARSDVELVQQDVAGADQ